MDDVRCEQATDVTKLKLELEQQRQRYRLISILAVATFATVLIGLNASELASSNRIVLTVLGSTALVAMAALAKYIISASSLATFSRFEQSANDALRSTCSREFIANLRVLKIRALDHAHLRPLLDAFSPRLERHRTMLLDDEALRDRRDRIAKLCADADEQVRAALERNHEANHEVQARTQLESAIPHLRRLVAEADSQFEEAVSQKTLNWWIRWTRDRGPLAEIEEQADVLEVALAKLQRSPTLIAADQDFRRLNELLSQRIKIARETAENAIPSSHTTSFDPDRAITVGILATAASVPISAVIDLESAGGVYDALREVNSNYVAMSDFEIWQETLVMPAESLAGLASLTKGAYFEKIVEQDFGGERFANFNHQDTDITIDGIDYQIKATDSAAYVESVADHIPVIATSEVAEQTSVIDGGLTDVQLTETIDLALGGTIIDVSDAIIDGATTGLGAVGIVAIIRGTQSAWATYCGGESALNALGVGLKTTSVSTARSAVNMAEMVYRGSKAVGKSAKRIISTDKSS